MQQEKLLSVIVPVYGTEKLLPKCLDSIIESSYKNIEIIVVDDKSPGNFDEVMSAYLADHTRNIKVVHHEVNKGLYHARITGVENASGEYIAFVDSDDHVSCDFYRRLMKQATDSDSDIVIGQYVLEYPDGRYTYQNLAHTRIIDINYYGEDIAKFLLEQYGMDYSLHVVWNKVYSKTLWDKALPVLKKQKKHLIMCEDVLFSCIIFSLAKHLTNIRGSDYYYYFKVDEASTSLKNAQYNKYCKSVDDFELVFDFLKKYFSIKDGKSICNWHNIIQSIWRKNIENSNLNKAQKKLLLEKFHNYSNENIKSNIESINYFYSVYTETQLQSEILKKAIISSSIKVISFDIFDTLIFRPFYEPTDLFCLLEIKAKNILNVCDGMNFKQLRIQAENIAREKIKNTNQEEISLDDIYLELSQLIGITKEFADKIKDEEIKLELKYCYQRKFAKELFDLAISLGKRVIITSDMYLPEAVIEDILCAQQYEGYNKLYLSSSILLTKASGNLYSYILKDLQISPKEILHIGDNKHSDIDMARAKGWNAFELYKTIDVLRGYTPTYNGSIFNTIFSHSFSNRSAYGFENYFGLKCMLGVIANELFDNPFIEINRESDFNIDPYFIGYFALGMKMFGLASWLLKDCAYYKYDNMIFLARDGYLPMLAFEKLNNIYHLNTKIHYVRFTRSSIIPFQLRSKADINSLIKNINIYAITPKKIIGMFSAYINKDILMNAQSIVENNGFIFDIPFSSLEQWYAFLAIFKEQFYNQKAIDNYVENMQVPLEKMYAGRTASFDVGYSCRSESALSRCYGFDISPYYMHINNDTALNRAESNNIKLHTFIGYTPAVTGFLREILISAQEPSCESMDVKNGQVIYKFKDYHISYQEKFAVENIQNSAMKFIEDMVRIFDDDIKYLYCQNEDTNLVYESLNNNPKYIDMIVFDPIAFEDDLGNGKKGKMCDFWRSQISTLQSFGSVDSYGTFNWVQPVWKRVVFLLLLNRGFLKIKVKEKYHNQPILLSIMGRTYKCIRWIYRRLN